MKQFLSFALIGLFCETALSQSFYENFEGVPTSDFASSSPDWLSIWSGDGWNTTVNLGGVSPNTDTIGTGDAFGSPADAFDNAIITGDTAWTDYAVEAEFFVNDDDVFGIVFRYTSLDSYYLLAMTRDAMPSYAGTVEYTGGQQTRLYRIDGDAQSVSAPVPSAHQSNPALRQRVRVEAAGNQIRAWLGSGSSPIDTSTPPFLDVVDTSPDALVAGQAGIYAFSMGNELAGTYFDSFRVQPIDSDGDGRNNQDEIAMGTDPFDSDSDDDGVSDGNEFQWTADPDGDSLINALDWDSDNDGLADGTEQGIVVPDPGTNILAGHFVADQDPTTTTNHLNPDTDNGGVLDGDEDLNHNGRYEYYLGETNPNFGDDDGQYPDAGPDTDTDTDTDVDSDVDIDTDTDTTDNADGGLGFLYGGHDCTCAFGCRRSGIFELIARVLLSGFFLGD